MNLTAAIKRQALDIGFDLVGIVRPEKLTEEATRLRAWLDRGFVGTMEWMESGFDKRTDPTVYVPEARSVVCVALNYYTTHPTQDRPGYGKVSRYAWGDDYHQVVGEQLDSLLNWICEQEPACVGKISVDTSPVMDKAWAARAGLGWIGKHSNLIHPNFGSWLFLGELFLNLELECQETPVADHCGTCTLCIESCPTDAIAEPYVVDARKCISYQTIEFRGEELEAETAGWIFGCDICQDVCPWNRFAKETHVTAFQPRPELVSLSLDELSSMTEEEFRAISKKSAVRRAKHRGMVRNAKHVRSRSKQAEGGSTS
ncbi:MAG TPA: tRNA epoxyqueuosine(34) reductase QueG [Acidobacteriota bacterium]|nr:tRNA epoxyqueuosine(34) reductase QueG [Acidobacteriota bacterium]